MNDMLAVPILLRILSCMNIAVLYIDLYFHARRPSDIL
jgi:hypothetical protein